MVLDWLGWWFLVWTSMYGVGVLASLVGSLPPLRGRRTLFTNLALALALLGSLTAAAGAGAALVDGDRWGGTHTLGAILPALAERGVLPPLIVQIRLDLLASGFTFLIAAFAAIVAVYSFAALDAPHFQRQRVWAAGAFNLFVWGTLMVVVVNDLFSLIVVLEIMTLAFSLLTLYKQDLYQTPQAHAPDHEQRTAARLAPQIYLIISHTSTAFLLLASLLLAQHAGGFGFDALRSARSSSTAIFFLALAGLGIRAGLTPAHFWVSLVHPASPTTTHAFSLGIAIKVTIYLMIRFFFQFLEPVAWWGYFLLVLAVVTAMTNVIYAIASHDLKRALAYHSVENIGIMTAGIGAALIFAGSDLRTLAVVALSAGLFHLLNHAIFKGLLYLATGAIERQTDQVVDIEKLGGLIGIWPWTSLAFLVGAVSIAGFPPFNGFISEWLTLQAMLGGVQATQLPLEARLALIVSMALLFAAFALTAFCFVKIAGIALLGRPRAQSSVVSEWQRKADAPWPMRGAMLLLAALCLLIGLLPVGTAQVLRAVASEALGYPAAPEAEPFVQVLTVRLAGVADASAALLIAFVAAGLLSASGWIIGRRLRPVRKDIIHPLAPWNCGSPYVATEAQFTGAALSFLVRDLLGVAWAPHRRSAGERNYLPAYMVMSEGASNVEPRPQQVVVERFRVKYNRLIDLLLRRSRRIEMAFQNGDLRRYLLYILIANLAVLVLFLFLLLTEAI